MIVATHSGNFHADDVFAVATLRLALGELELIRTRDRARYAEADVRVDLGGRSDPETGDFDHHQKGGAGERANGVRYASFGLVWREHGASLAGSPEAARAVDERLVQGIDANDTGQTIAESLVGGIRAMSVSGLIGAMNPDWDDELTAEQEDARFADAVAFATGILQRELAGSAAFQRAQDLVGGAIARADDPRVVELERNMPWREAVVTRAPEALFVVYPKSDGWALQAVPRELGGFGNRKDLPAAWAGLTDEALAEVTGVPDARFAHLAGFYAAAGSREGIMALVERALAA
ncbi:MAG: MYG1 family protein [Solirubrobacterales bacterium]|nr:MYG1 family protein [Solirubrobacterales bacterium]